MIIFDTNILRGVTRNNPKFDILRVLKRSGSHRAGIPWMVLEELAAKQVLEYAAAHASANTAIKNLNKMAPWDTSTLLAPLDTEKTKQYWRDQYKEVLEERGLSESDTGRWRVVPVRRGGDDGARRGCRLALPMSCA
jgi:hypothetical protein